MSNQRIAATIVKGDIVEVPGTGQVTVAKVESSTPEPGQITWVTPEGAQVVIGAATIVTLIHTSRRLIKETTSAHQTPPRR
jgi:hypothetical protein